MTSKAEKPTLAGQRIRSRKRDEKVKFDSSAFRDELVSSLNERTDIEGAVKYLEVAGNDIDYRRYAEQLFDILLTGGILAPGGSIVDDGADLCKYCVFNAEETSEGVKKYSDLMDRVIRRYKYLQVLLEDHLQKVLKFLKAFTEKQRNNLAKYTAQLMASGLCTSKPLASIFQDYLAKDGLSEECMFNVFRAWLDVQSINSLATSFRKSGIDQRLDEIYPASKRSREHLMQRLRETEGLEDIVTWQTSQHSTAVKKEVQDKLTEAITEDASNDELIELLKNSMGVQNLKDVDVISLIWTSIMESVEWNKKADLAVDQALRKVNQCCKLINAFTETEKAQVLLLVKIQNYCYDNQNLLKVFNKIVYLLYRQNVVGEDAVVDWHSKTHSSKGKSVFLNQLQPMIDWLASAEEEEA